MYAKKGPHLLFVLALLLTALMPAAAFAQDDGTSIYIPFVSVADGRDALDATQNAIPKSVNGVYIVILRDRPTVAYEGDVDGFRATKPETGQKLQADSPDAQAYDRYLVAKQDAILRSVGGSEADLFHNYTTALNGFAAKLNPEQLAALQENPDVVMILPDELRERTTESSPDFLGLTGPAGAWQTGYNGEGVVVGVIDDGIWPEHPSFADDGSYRPLPAYAGLPCEFGNTAHNPNDAPFDCNNKLLGARQTLDTYRTLIGADPDEFDSARDDNGHGTHTASTAAGNRGVAASVLGVPRGSMSGMAPRARVIAYKGLGNLGGFGSDLAAAIDQAVADGVDVINYSIGSSSFAIGPDDIAFLFAADAGVFVATSNGNSGPNPATTGSPASVPWLTSVGASTQPRYFQGSASSSDGWEFFGASITAGTDELPLVDAAAAGSELCIPGALDANVVAGKIVLCKRGAIARVDKGYAVYVAGGAGMILYNTFDADSLLTDTHWVPSVHINFTDGSAIKSYIASAGASAVAQINAGDSITVDAPWMAAFSSRGPNRLSGDIVKPDITAPGVQILAGWSPFPDPGSVPGELYAAIAGTSMSSPHIAGIFALIKQAHPDWTPAMAKSALMTTAYQDVMKENGMTPADPFDMGGGHVNVGSPVRKGSAFQPGLVYDAGLFEYAAFTCGAELGVFSAGTCAFLESIGVPTDPSDLNVPSIGIDGVAGSQTIRRTVTSVASDTRTFTAHVDAPEDYKVDVQPQQMKLKPGESATYYVTITNKRAPIGEWRFGSLTWKSAKGADNGNFYEVRSPIAVRAALFDAPDSVSGVGETGSASFNVTFGYRGSYSAASHGLEPATVISDNVAQDPDQVFNPNDGYSNLHQFNLSGAAFFRMAIPPEATEADADLDIFLYNPSGQLVASSTNGGTDELIDVVLPADGTWSLYVQGWAAPGGDSDYDLYTWIISATPGGNMTIDSAPTSATIGATETIDVSWTGATAGEWHLGAVSHTGDVGLMGLTLVEVDNR